MISRKIAKTEVHILKEPEVLLMPSLQNRLISFFVLEILENFSPESGKVLNKLSEL